MQAHYICLGDCRGMASNPGVCHTYGCSRYNKPLTACHCIDWKHDEQFHEHTETETKADNSS